MSTSSRMPVRPAATREQAIVSFLRSSASGVDARRPAPGFDSATYARHHEHRRDAANSFAHWMRAGRQDGPWRVEVIDPSNHTEARVAITLRRALHVHAFPPDLLDDIVARFRSEGPPCDLFVSVASDADAAQARRLFEIYRRGACDVRVVPNVGRDIGPFLTAFGTKLRAYDVIGHVHTKQSHVLNDREFVRRWREYLLENLLGGEHPSADVILGRFAEDPQLGIVYPDDPNLLDWGRNRDFADALARRMGIATFLTRRRVSRSARCSGRARRRLRRCSTWASIGVTIRPSPCPTTVLYCTRSSACCRSSSRTPATVGPSSTSPGSTR